MGCGKLARTPMYGRFEPNGDESLPNSTKSKPMVHTLAYDQLCTFEYGICVEIFSLTRPEIGGPLYQFRTIAVETGPLTAAGGLTVTADDDLTALDQADIVLVPGWRSIGDVPADYVCRALRRAHDNGARIASICSGIVVLAAAGLLAGRRATTHWRYVQPIRQRFPDIDIIPDVLYVDEGDVLTSAGSAAGIDLCLSMVRADHGADVANAIARSLVIPAHRDGGQRQFIPQPVPVGRPGELAAVFDTLRANIATPWTVDDIAALATTSRRTLLRRFQEATGQSPTAWLTGERIRKARDLLETTNSDIGAIADAVGFGAPETFRMHFRRHLGISPSRYRAQFKAGS